MSCGPMRFHLVHNFSKSSQTILPAEISPAPSALNAVRGQNRCRAGNSTSWSGVCLAHRAQLASKPELLFKSNNRNEDAASTSGGRNRSLDSGGAPEDASDSKDSDNSRPPSGPPPSSEDALLRRLISETVADVALPGTLAIIAAYLLQLDAFGHFNLTYSAASSAILASAPWCFARIVLLLGDFSGPTRDGSLPGAAEGALQLNALTGNNSFILSRSTKSSNGGASNDADSEDVSASAASHSDTNETRNSSQQSGGRSTAVREPPSILSRSKAALHMYQSVQVLGRNPLPAAVEVPLLLSRQFAVEMFCRAVGLSFAAGWLVDRMYEAGANPTATSSVAMQATPLLILVGALFYVGAAALKVKQTRNSMKREASLLGAFLSKFEKEQSRKKRTARLNGPSQSPKQDAAKDADTAVMAMKNMTLEIGGNASGESSDDSIMNAQLQKITDCIVVSTACKIANFSLMSSVFLTTGNMAASWVAGVMVAGTQVACKGVRRDQLKQRQMDTINNLMADVKSRASRKDADSDAGVNSSQDQDDAAVSTDQSKERKSFRERRQEARGKSK